MLSFVLSPLVDVLRRIGLWRAAAVALSVLVALGAIGLIGTLLGSQAATLAADVPQYVEAVQSKVERIQALATTRVASITRLLSGGKPATAPVAAPAVRPRGGRTRCGGSSGRHAATAARRRARHAEVLGARGRSGRDRAGPWPARDHRHCLDRGDFHPDAARGPARQVHPPLWLHGSAPDDNGDGRCGPTPQPILRVAAGRECLLRRGDRRGTLADRRTVRSALGRAGRSAPVRPLRRAAAGGGCPADACGGRRSRLVDDQSTWRCCS